MKRRILALLLAVLTLTALTAAAFAADTPETLGAFNLKDSKGYNLTVVGTEATGGFYAGANRFTLTCDGLDGNYSLVLLLKEGEDQADGTEGVPTPTKSNLQYIDQQNINAAKKATFDLFPKSLEKGVYNVYVSTDKVNLKKVASFEYNTEPEYIPGDVNDDTYIDIYDVSALLSYLAEKRKLTAKGLLAADVAAEKGVIDIYDASRILRYLAGTGKFE